MADRVELDAERTRRESLYDAIAGLKDALATPVDDSDRWRLRMAMAVDHATMRINEHVDMTEARGGFLDRIVQDVPRLSRRITQMRVEHERLQKEAHALRMAIADLDDEPERTETVRRQAEDFLVQLTRHRQHGTDFIDEAGRIDIADSA